jgi:hypothetical protein
MSHVEIAFAQPGLSLEQQRMVLGTLRSILDSPHFSKSKRYPALLEFAVRAALDENSSLLKERTLGIEVFGRRADYDTSSDAVVRIAAGEVRRRMALYFAEHPDAPVRIGLPVGSYKAEFYFRLPAAHERSFPEPQVRPTVDNDPEFPQPDTGGWRPGPVPLPVRVPRPKGNSRRLSTRLRVGLLALLLAIVAGAVLLQHWRDTRGRELWLPVLQNDAPAIILVGRDPTPRSADAGAGQAETAAFEPGEQNSLVLYDAIATAKVCSVFRKYGRDCEIVPARLAKLEDIRGKSVVLVGALDNPWTARLLAPLRYQAQFDTATQPESNRARMIVEHKPTGDIPLWKIGHDDLPKESGKDYAIVARFRSDITDGMVVVVAGLGSQGTNIAGKYVSSPEKVSEILSRAPKGWKNFNFEAVLQIDVVQGSSGHVEVIASNFW